ncbi:MAG: glycosyltransferase family 39 protein [Chloroflexi bacterium]|nr:glycosyltransferase family 39 protein [Chloroflexota bacterium]
MLLRLAAALYLGNEVVPLPGSYDQISYDALAQRVASGHGFSFDRVWWPATRAEAPTAHWSFLYTGLLAGVYALLGHQPLVARLLQAGLVGLLLPWGSWHLAARTVGRRAAPWAALCSAVYVYFVYYSATLMTEMLTITAVVWLLVVASELAERPTWRVWAGLGALVGVAGLLRQVTLLPVPLLCLWILWRHRSWRSLVGIAAAAAIALTLILPITLRNHRVFDRFVLVNTNAGYAFFWANHPIHGTSFQSILPSDGPSYADLIPKELLGLDEAALNDALLARGWGFVRQDPVRYLRLSFSRFEDYFEFWPARDSSRLSNLSRVGSFGLFLPFMLVGLYLSRRRWRACMPLYLFAGAYTLLHLLSWALIRYRLPVDAVLLVFAGAALERIPLGRWAATGLGRRGAT